MYLTAQRVLTPKGETGINVFLHCNAVANEALLLTPNEIAAIADANPGDIVAHRCEVKPGGNRVLSFIDVVAPELYPLEGLRTVLDEAKDNILSAPLPISLIEKGIGIRFGANYGLYEALPKEFDELVFRALSLLEERQAT